MPTAHGGDHQSDGQHLQAHQRAAHHVGRDLVAQRRDLRRQQPHPHGAHSRCGPRRIPPAGQCGQSLSAAGLDPRCRHAWRRSEDGSRQAPRHRHVCRRPHGEGRQEAAAQSARRAARISKPTHICARRSGKEVSGGYLKLKHNEWNQYCRHLTQWERDTTLDCLAS